MWASGVKSAGGVVTYDSKLLVHIASDQVIATASWTTILWATADYDGLSEFDAANNRIVIAAAGYYRINYVLQTSNLGAAKEAQVRLMADAAEVTGGVGVVGDATFGYTKWSGGIEAYFASGVVLTMDVYHNFGANRSLIASIGGGCKWSFSRFA